MVNIPVVGKVLKCPMCDSSTVEGFVGMRYHQGIQYHDPAGAAPVQPCSRLDDIATNEEDDEYDAFLAMMEHHLCRMCRCGYGWVERPVSGVPIHELTPDDETSDGS